MNIQELNITSEMTTRPSGGETTGKNNYPFIELEKATYSALETYSNVHRGHGHFSTTTTRLYEKAREIVLEYLKLDRNRYRVIFSSPRNADAIISYLKPGSFQLLSSENLGLSAGVRAIAVKRSALPRSIPFLSGGGTSRLVSPDRLTRAHKPERFEAGTPAIINIIMFSKALKLSLQFGDDFIRKAEPGTESVNNILYDDQLLKLYGRDLLEELKSQLIGKDQLVPSIDGQVPFINLDNAASTPTFLPVWDAFRMSLRLNEEVKKEIISEVRNICGSILGAPWSTYDITFTSNTTEAINLCAESLANEIDDSEPVIISSLLEHSSNDLPWRDISNAEIIRLSIDKEGFLDLDQLEILLKENNKSGKYPGKRIKLVALSGASNVLGVYNDLEKISKIVHRYEAKLLVDAAQMVAHRKMDMLALDIDYLAFSVHKVYAPFGCGVLVSKKGLLSFKPDEMQAIRNAGEENTAGIAALGKAMLLLERIGMDTIEAEERELTSYLIEGMSSIPGITIHGIADKDCDTFGSKGGVVAFSLKAMISFRIARELAQRGGIGVRAGCHCAHILVKHVLGIPPWAQKVQHIMLSLFPKLELPGITRVSLGIENNRTEIEKFLEVLREVAVEADKANRKSNKRSSQDKEISRQVKLEIESFVEAVSSGIYD
jgi:selenocysteine lyase/cysteine desulfurase